MSQFDMHDPNSADSSNHFFFAPHTSVTPPEFHLQHLQQQDVHNEAMSDWLNASEAMDIATDAGYQLEYAPMSPPGNPISKMQFGQSASSPPMYSVMDSLGAATAQMSMSNTTSMLSPQVNRSRSHSDGAERSQLPVLQDAMEGFFQQQQQQQLQFYPQFSQPVLSGLISPPALAPDNTQFSMFPLFHMQPTSATPLEFQQPFLQQHQQQQYIQQPAVQQAGIGRRPRANTIPGSSALHLLNSEVGTYNSSNGLDTTSQAGAGLPYSPIAHKVVAPKRDLPAPYSKSPHVRHSNSIGSLHRGAAIVVPSRTHPGLTPISTGAPFASSMTSRPASMATALPISTPISSPLYPLQSAPATSTSFFPSSPLPISSAGAARLNAVPILPISSTRKIKTTEVPPTISSPEQYAKLDAALLAADFDDITVTELKEMLRQRSLPSSGKKAVLVQRLQEEMTLIGRRADGSLKNEDDPRHPLHHQVKQLHQLRQLQAFHASLQGFDTGLPDTSVTQSGPDSAGAVPSPGLPFLSGATSPPPTPISATPSLSPSPSPTAVPVHAKAPTRTRARAHSDPRFSRPSAKTLDLGSPLRNGFPHPLRNPIGIRSQEEEMHAMQTSENEKVAPTRFRLLAPAPPKKLVAIAPAAGPAWTANGNSFVSANTFTSL
ncbi:hypothetical protein HKX48_000535 [Thoreauomyces humboldtii]|nr:hypothetical protein HKX48_000535 [Thoreauomyces humboldtii]